MSNRASAPVRRTVKLQSVSPEGRTSHISQAHAFFDIPQVIETTTQILRADLHNISSFWRTMSSSCLLTRFLQGADICDTIRQLKVFLLTALPRGT